MYYPSPSPSHLALPSSASKSTSAAPTPVPTSAPYFASFKLSSGTSSKSSHPLPRAPSKDFLPLPSVAEYRSGLSTPTASPAPSSRRTNHPITPAVVKFTSILTSPSPSSRFDFFNPHAPNNTYSHDLAFASAQVSSYIPILCGPLNILIYIQNPSSQMTCREFLCAVSTALAQPVSPYDEEWLQVGPQYQEDITKAYHTRLTRYQDPYLRKIDFLLNKTYFKGLRFAYNAWALATE